MSGLYDRFKQGLMNEEHDMDTDVIKIALLDLDDLGTSIDIASSTNATPIAVTYTAAHGLTTGDHVTINNHLVNTAANGYWTITVTSTTVITLDTSSGNGVGGATGFAVDLTNDTAWADISAGLVGTAQTIVSPTITNGVFDDNGSNITYTSVTGDPCEALIIYNDTPTTPIADPLIACIDDATGLPVTPNSGDITVTFDTAGIFAL
jgi:hypothetical protein